MNNQDGVQIIQNDTFPNQQFQAYNTPDQFQKSSGRQGRTANIKYEDFGEKQFVEEVRYKYQQNLSGTPYQFWSNQGYQLAQRNGYFKGFQGLGCGCSAQVALQVIPKDEIEAPWRRECEYLWTLIRELERKKGGGDPELINRLQQRIKELEDELKALKKKNEEAELESGRNEEEDEAQNAMIESLKKELQAKNDELEALRKKYAELESRGTMVVQEKVTYLSQEVDVWKQKFIKLNHEFNQQQEELIMAQAELESLKKGAEKKEMIVTKTIRTSSHTSTSGSGGLVVTSSETRNSQTG